MSASLTVLPTALAGVCVLQRHPRADARGFFERLFCDQLLEAWLGDAPVRQVNHTLTRRRGTVRGLHYQRHPHAETKVVACLHGEILDVAVDLRAGSPTFRQWHAERLSGDNHRSLLIPPGVAHGFQALTDDCALLYLHTAPYVADAEGGVHPADPAIGIDWPLPVVDLSARDQAHPPLPPDFAGLDT